MSLPVIQPKQKIRPSRSTRWRAGVLIGVHLVIAAHITHWLVSGSTLTPVEPSEAAALARSGVINAGLIFFAVAAMLTLVFGRFFCGWACHLVALQDLSRSLLERFGRRPKPLRSRLLRWVPLAAFVYSFLLPAWQRWRAGATGHLETEFTTTQFWATFPGWILGSITFIVCGYLVVYFLGAKGFCTYACPYGAVFDAAERLAPMRIRVTDACEGCGHCTAVCTSNVRVHEEVRDFGMVVDSGCMKCLDCVSVCPNDALYYGVGKPPLFSTRRASGRTMRKYPLSWAEEGILAVAFIAGYLTFRGLYGYVPFLMALGVAGVLAYLALLTFQLATRRNLSFKSWRFKVGGEIQSAGTGFLVVMALVLAFWLHSGSVRLLIARADTSVGVVARWHQALYDHSLPRPEVSRAGRAALERSLESLERVERIGLVPTRGAASRMAAMQFILGHDRDAARLSRRAIQRGEPAVPMHQLLARIAAVAGNPAGAAAELERAIVADPRDMRSRTGLAVNLAQQGDLAGAAEVLQAAQTALGETADLVYNLGLVEAYSGRLGSAVAKFDRALELDPEHLPARENLAGLLAASGQLDASAEHYARAISQSPNDPLTRVFFGQVLLALGRLEESREQASTAIDLAPDLEVARELAAALGLAGERARLSPPSD